jgi:flotillin
MESIPTQVWVIGGLAVLVIMFIALTITRMYRIAGPNEAFIVTGMRGLRIVNGGGTIVLPLIENARQLSLELMSFDVAPVQDLYTNQGVAVTVEAVAQIKVKSDHESIRTAAEQFLTKTS